jgi:hypothetical protein
METLRAASANQLTMGRGFFVSKSDGTRMADLSHIPIAVIMLMGNRELLSSYFHIP